MADHFSTYIYQKRGFFYFSRRIPKEVQSCHSKQRTVLGLNTRSRAKALKYSQVMCQRSDERWLPTRLDALGLGNVMANDVKSLPSPTLTEAIRNVGVVVDVVGDKPIADYSTIDAGKVRDAMIAKGLAVLSGKRTFITIKAIINLAIAEHGLDIRNPFSFIFMPEVDSKKRVSIPVETIREIQQACHDIDDDTRWLVALISDTGMRLAEVAGLHLDDLYLDEKIPYGELLEQSTSALTKTTHPLAPFLNS